MSGVDRHPQVASFWEYVAYAAVAFLFSLAAGWIAGVAMMVVFVVYHRHGAMTRFWPGVWLLLKASLLAVLVYLMLSECQR